MLLTLEHRSAKAPQPMVIRLACLSDGAASHLELLNHLTNANTAGVSIENRLAALLDGHRPLTRIQLRSQLRINNQRLGEALCAMEKAGRIRRTSGGWLRSYSSTEDAKDLP